MSNPVRSGLLPPNQSRLEAAFAEAITPGYSPAVIESLWDAGRCPARLLPWLAWALSVDEWDTAWTEAQQRAAIAGSIELHRRKGTPWAVKQALQRAGFPRTDLDEKPEGAHWAEFDIDVTVVDRPITEDTLDKLERLITAFKAERSTLRNLSVSLGSVATMQYAAVALTGETITVYPHQLTELPTSPAVMRYAAAAHTWETLSVYPPAP